MVVCDARDYYAVRGAKGVKRVVVASMGWQVGGWVSLRRPTFQPVYTTIPLLFSWLVPGIGAHIDV